MANNKQKCVVRRHLARWKIVRMTTRLNQEAQGGVWCQVRLVIG